MAHQGESQSGGRDSSAARRGGRHGHHGGFGHGVRQRLTRDLIVEAALDLVDEYGLELFSMRRLARRLGVAVMALYRYFPARDDLLADLARQIFDAPVPEASGDEDWRKRLVGLSTDFRKLLLGHPNALPLLFTHGGVPLRGRPSAEAMLDAFERAGLGPKEAVDAWRALGAYLVGYVNVERLLRSPCHGAPTPRTPTRPPAALARVAPYLDRSWDEQFAASLGVVLDGIAKIVDASRADAEVRTSGRRGGRSST